MKKILITSNSSWNIYNFRLDLIFQLSEKFDIVVLSPIDDYTQILTKKGIKHFEIKINQKGINIYEDLSLCYNYYKYFYALKPDLILSYTIKPNIYASLTSKILGIPIISNVSGLGTTFIKKNWVTKLSFLLYKISFFKNYHIFFQNNYDRNIFLSKKIVNQQNSSIVPGSGVDTDVFNFKRNNNKAKNFLFVGRIIKDKGVFEYLEMAKKITEIYPRINFFLVGEINCNNKTSISQKELTKHLKENIKYLGKVHKIKKLLENNDVVILPSYREGLSKSLIEASSMRMPLIATNVPGCNDIVKDGYNGFLVKPYSSKSLFVAVKKMINMTEYERLKMGENSRKRVLAYYSNKHVIDSYSKIIYKFFNN